jgi:hypothetical protein
MSVQQIEGVPVTFAAFLAGHDLTSVAIIDDAYDHWSTHLMREDEADQLWSMIENDPAARDELNAKFPDVDSGADLASFMLEEAANAAGPDSVLGKIVHACDFRRRIDGKADAVKSIEQQLAGPFGLQVRTQGIDAKPDQIQDVQVVFLDWRLGPDQDALSKARAGGAARKIYESFPDGKKPIIVLMSDDSALKEFSSKFRIDSDLIEGLFRAIPKPELRTAQSLALHILAIAHALKPAHVVQRFTDAVIQRAANAVKDFESAIRGLSLSDYANIQHLSLRADGHPLGDYMCWLFAGFLSDIWFGEAIASERRLLDQFDFEKMVASPEQPSGTLAKIYHSAVFDMGVGAIQDHPRAAPREDGRLENPNLALGDILLRRGQAAGVPPNLAVTTPAEETIPVPATATLDENASAAEHAKALKATAPDLYVIMNAQCDLAMSPGQTRAIPKDSSILLVPGKIRSLDDSGGDQASGSFATPLFVHQTISDGKGAWVEWNLRSLRTVEYGKFHDWANGADGGYERIARMRALQALALQQDLSGRNTRIGLPVVPPIYRKLPVTLQIFDNGNIRSENTDDHGMAILVGDPGRARRQLIALTVPCLQRIRTEMSGRIESLKAGGAGRLTPAEVEAALLNAECWQRLLVPFGLTASGEKKEFGELLVIAAVKGKIPNISSRKTIARIVVHIDESELAWANYGTF